MFTATAAVLAQAPAAGAVGLGETVVFWVLGPLALLGALGMVFARSAVHSALWLVLTMLCLGVLYMAQSAQFLGFTQIIVYTGAIMMLFLFVLMMVGRDASDSVVEVLRGQRLTAIALGVGFALLLSAGLARSLTMVQPAPPLNPWSLRGGGAGGLGRMIFTEYLFPFELTSALLITAAVGAMVLAYGGKGRAPMRSQREMVEARFRGEYARPSSLPGPGVYATANSVATPALLPDGSVAPESLSRILDNTPAERLTADRAAVSGHAPEPDPHALTGRSGPAHPGAADDELPGTEEQARANPEPEDPGEGESTPKSGSNGNGNGSHLAEERDNGDHGGANGNAHGEPHGDTDAAESGREAGTDSDSPEEVRR